MPARKAPPQEVYQIKITLRHIKPPVWRRFQVPSDIKLSRLHDVVQDVMGWTDSHLHQFTIGGVEYSAPDPYGDDWGMDSEDERKARLNQVAGAKAKFDYVYDFGDSWEHQLVVEKVLAPEPGVRYPICLAGARSCPPEDCGGPWGYEDFLEAIRSPDHPQHEDLSEWIGGEFDPEAFSVDEVNKGLRR